MERTSRHGGRCCQNCCFSCCHPASEGMSPVARQATSRAAQVEGPSSSASPSKHEEIQRQNMATAAEGGHTFGKKTFHKPTYCHHCSDLLWGLIGQGYICEGKSGREHWKPRRPSGSVSGWASVSGCAVRPRLALMTGTRLVWSLAFGRQCTDVDTMSVQHQRGSIQAPAGQWLAQV